MGLVERQYLGIGYIHMFKHEKTGDLKIVPCTLPEFTDSSIHQPVLADYTWVGSTGGTAKVDTPDTILGEMEYCVINGKVLINEIGKARELVTTEEFMIDTSLNIL